MIMFRFLILISFILSAKCSEHLKITTDGTDGPLIIEKPLLERQRNTPRSQSILNELASKQRENEENGESSSVNRTKLKENEEKKE